MTVDDNLLKSLRAALERAPADAALRLHYAALLLDAGRTDDAVQEVAHVLRDDPRSAEAQVLMRRAVGGSEPEVVQEFDWDEAASQLGDVVAPMFLDPPPADSVAAEAWDIERAEIRLDDVGGLVDVKERLELSFLGPLRNPELRRLYGKSLRGGLLL